MLNDAHDIATITRTTAAAVGTDAAANVEYERGKKQQTHATAQFCCREHGNE